MRSTKPHSFIISASGGKVTCNRNSNGWVVYFPAERDGKPKRLRKRFDDLKSARHFAEQKAHEINQHGVRFGTLPDEVRDAYRAYRELADKFTKKGIEVPPFGLLVRQKLDSLAADMIPGESSVAEGIERFLAARKTELTSKGYHSIRTRLLQFARSLGDRSMESITAPIIDDWLSGLTRQRAESVHGTKSSKSNLSAHSLNHYRAALATFYTHAEKQGWVSANPVKSVRRVSPVRSQPEVFTAEQVSALLTTALTANPSVFPVLVLQMFAGLRRAEAANVELSHICDTQDSTFQVAASKFGPRDIPISNSLRAWLSISPRQHAFAWPGSHPSLRRQLAQIFEAIGCHASLESPRITYLRYRLELTGDLAQLSAETGCPFGIFDTLVRIPVESGAAERFFQLTPNIDR